MRKGPGFFSDFGHKAKEILTKDYSCEQKLSISTKSDTGVALVSTAVNTGGLSTGNVAAQYKYKKAIVDVKVDTESNLSTTLSVTDYPASTKTIVSCKVPDYNSGKMEIQYFHDHGSVSTAIGLNKSTAIDFSATIGTPSIAFGTEATYLVSSRNFTKYNAGVSLTKVNFCTSVILADKGDAIRVSYLHHLDQLKRGAAVGEMTRKFSTNDNTLTVGCSYAVDPYTVVKAKLNNHGDLGALLQHQLKPNSFLTICGNFDTKAMDKRPRFGLALSLKP